MTIIRLSQEAGGLSISVEGAEGSATTIVLSSAHAGQLAIASPAGSASAFPPARPFRSWLLGGLCFIVAAGLVTLVMGRHSASGANAASSVATATPTAQAPEPIYPVQGPDQMPSALASAFSQPTVVVPPPGAAGGLANGAAAAPAPAAGSLFGLQP